MRTVKTLEECDKTKVWRCVECTMAWINFRLGGQGAWCRLDTFPRITWTPLTFEPTPFPGVGPDGPWETDGPAGFYELGSVDELDYSDYRNGLSQLGSQR